jgi:hypothetical protein
MGTRAACRQRLRAVCRALDGAQRRFIRCSHREAGLRGDKDVSDSLRSSSAFSAAPQTDVAELADHPREIVEALTNTLQFPGVVDTMEHWLSRTAWVGAAKRDRVPMGLQALDQERGDAPVAVGKAIAFLNLMINFSP